MDITRWSERNKRLYFFTILPLLAALGVWMASATIADLAVGERGGAWISFGVWAAVSAVLFGWALVTQLRIPLRERKTSMKQAQNLRWLVFIPAWAIGRLLSDSSTFGLFIAGVLAGGCSGATLILLIDALTGRFSKGVPWGARSDPRPDSTP